MYLQSYFRRWSFFFNFTSLLRNAMEAKKCEEFGPEFEQLSKVLV